MADRTKWFIEGDISDCFGSLDHEVMLAILSEKIRDGRFLGLVRNMLTAGYLEDWRWNATLRDSARRGCLTDPLQHLPSQVGPVRRDGSHPAEHPGDAQERQPCVCQGGRKLSVCPQTRVRDKARALRRELRCIPRGDTHDTGYRRLRYSRYADDHLLGFIGPKAEAEKIKGRLAAFLCDELKLELSAKKTLITHARDQPARYLGYEIIVQHGDSKITGGQRAANGKVALRVPQDVIKAKCAPYRCHGKPWHRSAMQNLDDYDIVKAYGAEYRGIVQYYLLANDVWRLNRLRCDAGDVDAQDPGSKAPVHGDEDGGQTPGQDQNATWTT